MGNLQSNDGEDGQSEGVKDEAWRQLLDDNGGLKPWREVSALKPKKINLGVALREYMRLAWGEIFFLFLFSLSHSIQLS